CFLICDFFNLSVLALIFPKISEKLNCIIAELKRIGTLIRSIRLPKDRPTSYPSTDRRVQSLMIEINRWLYLREDYSVDLERTKTLVSVLRRVAEVLEHN
ncbi:MAG: hypothetical protein ACO390_16825, partial [bacterium]